MSFFIILPAILSLLMLAAHILHRSGSLFLALTSLMLGALLFTGKRWTLYVLQVVLALAAVEWLFTTYAIVQQRQSEGTAWARAAIILIAVAVFNVVAAGLLKFRKTALVPSQEREHAQAACSTNGEQKTK